MRIDRADFADAAQTAELAEFLRAHHADMAPLAPPESQHALNLAGLQDPRVRLWLLCDDDGLLGTVALATVDDRHDELKSMRVAPHARGRKVGRALLTHAVDDARARAIGRISLETGSQDFFTPARRLYAAAGFTECGPFGSYVDDPHSVFMTLVLA